MSYPTETLKQAGYEHVEYNSETKEHILKNTATGELEIWVARKNFAGYSIKYKNTNLEFCSTLKP